MFEVNRNPSARDLRRFGWVMLIGFGVLGAVVWLLMWRRGPAAELFAWTGATGQVAALALWVLGALLCGLSLAAPVVARPIYVIWMTLASAIGVVISTVTLSLLFFVVLPPFSLIVRRGDPLRKQLTSGGSYWENYKPYEPTLERMSRLF